MKIAIGALMHESNTFAPGRTTLDDFRRTQYLAGDDLFAAHRGTPSEIGGMLEVLEAAGAGLEPLLSAWAMPSPLVSAATYAQIRAEMLARLARCSPDLDGVLLCLHGSMTVEGTEDPEGDLLAAVRAARPQVSHLVASLDHHANVTEQMVAHADLLVGYRTHPHVDQFDVGASAARGLVELIDDGPRIAKSFIKMPMLTPAENRSEPVVAMREQVERVDGDPSVLSCSFFVGYPWADLSILGASVLVVTRGDQDAADRHARTLADAMWARRDEFLFPIHPPEQAVRLGRAAAGRPVVLDELADCTLGGASGDVVTTARYFHEQRIGDSVVVGIVDPESVRAAEAASVGKPVRLSIGGRVCVKDNPPLEIEGVVESVHRDVFGDTSVHSGYETPLGAIAVVVSEGLRIILIERAGRIGGPSFLEALGIDPKRQAFIIVKDGLNPFETYKDVAAEILMVDSAGFDRQILRREDYRNAPKPMYPLERDFDF